jgi:hypothetical protein
MPSFSQNHNQFNDRAHNLVAARSISLQGFSFRFGIVFYFYRIPEQNQILHGW